MFRHTPAVGILALIPTSLLRACSWFLPVVVSRTTVVGAAPMTSPYCNLLCTTLPFREGSRRRGCWFQNSPLIVDEQGMARERRAGVH